MTTNSFWSGRRVLVTGHTGFKGAWLALWLTRLGARVSGLSLPPEHADGAFCALGLDGPGISTHLVDLRDGEDIRGVVADVAPEIVFHLGAQALVRRGWADPAGTYAVNVVGTANLLEAVSGVGSVSAVVVATSDKVYANPGGVPLSEDDPLGGRDPYSASKAAAEFVVQAWRNGGAKPAVATVRAGNVIGGGDVAEDRLLPDAWRALRDNDPIVVRHPAATRPWQFALEPLRGYLAAAQALVEAPFSCPPSVNFGPAPAACVPVAEVIERVLDRWGAGTWVDGSQPSDPPEAPTLSLDAGLAARWLGWEPVLDLHEAISWTVAWWRAAAAGVPLRDLAEDQIDAYEGRLF